MAIELALYQPEIPQNTGTLIRLCACFDTLIHIIHPTAFAFTQKNLRRGGLDYLDEASIVEHASHAAFDAWRNAQQRRLVLLTTKAKMSAFEVAYASNDILMVGRESSGVPESVATNADLAVRIPMRHGLRSINVALAATLVLGEAKRQTDKFIGLT